jgi:hypothetical protein
MRLIKKCRYILYGGIFWTLFSLLQLNTIQILYILVHPLCRIVIQGHGAFVVDTDRVFTGCQMQVDDINVPDYRNYHGSACAIPNNTTISCGVIIIPKEPS